MVRASSTQNIYCMHTIDDFLDAVHWLLQLENISMRLQRKPHDRTLKVNIMPPLDLLPPISTTIILKHQGEQERKASHYVSIKTQDLSKS
jgi:hypothetical protein